jgi:arylsulfatase A-like enzyme
MIKWNFGKTGWFGRAFALASTALMVNGCDSATTNPPPENGSDRISNNAPNIIYIFVDDLGYGDVSLNNAANTRNSVVDTPNINAIAAWGFNFVNGYVAAPVCAPSRASLITSRFPSTFGFESNPLIRSDNPNCNFTRIGQNILPKKLKEIGYSTAVIGKWDLGGSLSGNGNIGNTSEVGSPELLPYGRGFDYFYGFLAGKNSYYRTGANDVPSDGWRLNTTDGYNGTAVKGGTVSSADGGRNIREFGLNGTTYQPGDRYVSHTPDEHLTDIFTTKALAYLDAHANKEKPFFLYLTYNAPHAPYHVPDEFYQKYQGLPDKTDAQRIYYAMIDQLDTRIGDVLAKLEDLGIRNNTIVAFASDNGGVITNPGGQRGPAYNGGMNGGKFETWDGGIRVPFSFCWPAVYSGGQTIDELVTSLDIMPTLLRAAGYSGAAVKAMNLDGVDMHPLLSKKQNGPLHEYFFWRAISEIASEHKAIKYAVRKGNLKYNYYREPGEPGEEYLFDLSSNRGEKTDENLADDPAYRKELISFKLALSKWEASMQTLPAGTPIRN